jgi:hypothetical protein
MLWLEDAALVMSATVLVATAVAAAAAMTATTTVISRQGAFIVHIMSGVAGMSAAIPGFVALEMVERPVATIR